MVALADLDTGTTGENCGLQSALLLVINQPTCPTELTTWITIKTMSAAFHHGVQPKCYVRAFTSLSYPALV